MTAFLFSLYVGTGLFGLGITVIDLLGLLGDDDHGEAGHDDTADAVGDDSTHGDADTHADAEGSQLDTHDGDHSDLDHHISSQLSHDIDVKGNRLIRILGIIRSLIYFSAGFGPTGLAALLMGKGDTASLGWGAAVGFIVLAGARFFRRLMKKDLDSSVQEQDLIMETGIVTVSIHPGQLGKVRINVSGVYADRYAKGTDNSLYIKAGTRIQVVDLDDSCVYVEEI